MGRVCLSIATQVGRQLGWLLLTKLHLQATLVCVRPHLCAWLGCSAAVRDSAASVNRRRGNPVWDYFLCSVDAYTTGHRLSLVSVALCGGFTLSKAGTGGIFAPEQQHCLGIFWLGSCRCPEWDVKACMHAVCALSCGLTGCCDPCASAHRIALKTRHVFCAVVVPSSVIKTVASTTLHSSSVRRSTHIILAVAVW